MTHQTTTYMDSGNLSLPLAFADGQNAEVRRVFRRVFLLFIMMVMGVGSAWAQTVSVWDGTVPSTANVSKTECNKIGITGSGTDTAPYVISTAGQFAYFASKMNGNTAWWELAENIELNLDGENHPWTYGQSNANFKGHFDGNGSTISNMKFETNATGKNFGLFPQLQGSGATDHAYIKNLTIKNCKITTPDSGTSYGKTTLTGILVGKAAGNTDIENVTISGCSIAYDVTTTDANYVGVLVGSLNGDNNTVKGCTVNSSMENSVETPTTITAGSAQKKNFYAGGLVGYAENNSLVTGNTVTASITLDGATSGNNYIGGLVGYIKGANSTVSNELPMGKRSIVKNNIVTPTITMNGEVATATFSMGGVVGWTDSHVNVLNNKVTPTLSITNDVNNTAYVGGAIGYMAGYTYADGMTVSGGSISSNKTTDKTVKNNITFFVGGFLGYQVSSGTGVFQANKFKNVAVTDMNINLGHYVPAGTINNHKFAVGGIAGSINEPNLDATNNWDGMPENIIFKGGKIYAPYAATSPTVANFKASNATYNNYTGENTTTVDELIKSKRNTWYYSDYQLGLATDIISKTNAYNATPANGKVKRNYSKTTTTDTDDSNLEWLTVDGSTFMRKNRYLDNDRESWTVLWWTRSDNNASYANTDIEQTIFPQNNNGTYTPFNTSEYNYYMYFYQGVANAKYASATDADAIIAGIAANMTEAAKATPVTLAITNDKENERGFDERIISVSATSDETDVTANYTYQWYLNGKAYTTGSSINLTPHWKDGQGLTVNALSGSTIVATATYTLVPGVMKTKAGSTEKVRSDYTGRGSSSNPYIIDCENALRQLSYLSTAHTSIRWEGVTVPGVDPKNQSQGHYNRAYYELGADITMGKDPFVPISHMGTNSSGSDGTYAQNWIFQGSFDGKGHKISELNITWGAGQYNGGANVYHGLFGAVGNPTATNKWQDASTGSTVIKNLIIDNATLTHDANNTSFYYNNGNSGNANNCMVGVLVGIVNSNTTIQNIEIRSSKITDAGSSDYSLAKYGLYVGGAIGSIQNNFGTTVTGLPTNTQIDHIAAQVDITLTHPTFVSNPYAVGEVGQFNVGGIIGRYVATSAAQSAVQETLPKYTFYSGNINAPKAWISPVLGALRYNSQQATNSWANLSKQWEGNNNAAGTQLTITNAQYYNFRIGGSLITELYPDNRCVNDARPIKAHEEAITETATSYDARKYQGVNYGVRFIDSDETTLYFLNQEPADDIYWVWDDGFPHMTNVVPIESYLTRDNNDFTAEITSGIGSEYRWQISFDGESWTDIDGITTQNYNAIPNNKAKIIVAIVTKDGNEYRTQAEKIAFVERENPYIECSGNNTDGYELTFSWNGNEPSGTTTVTYQWYKSDQTTPLDGQTNISVNLSKDEIDAAGGMIWCKATIKEFGADIATYFVNCTPGAIVVFLQLNDVVASNGTSYSQNNAGTNTGGNDSYGVKQVVYASAEYGKTPDKPVNSWAEAYALLNPYTEPTQADVTAHGGTWKSATNYDDEAYYLANKDSYPFDIYKRNSKLRKVKPIEKCTNNWNNNIIVVMGLSNDNYFSENNNDIDGTKANKPVTITGQYNGINYYGFLSHSSSDFSINADHKFENMGIGVSTGNISATAQIRYRIYAHRWNVWAGRGMLMGWAAALKWGPDVVPVTDANKLIYKITNADPSTGTPYGNYTADIAIMGGYLNDNTSDNPEMFEYINHGRDDVGQQIKIESGFWGPVCPGNRQTGDNNTGSTATNTYYTMGGPDHPAKTTITVDISREDNDGNEKFNSAMPQATVDVGCLLSGNHEGTMYADVTLNILSAKMGRIVNGIKGAQRRRVTKPTSYTTAGRYRHIINYGTKESPVWTEIAAPAPDSYFGRGIMNFDPSKSINNAGAGNDAINVIELYCGSLGRGHNDGNRHPEVRSYFYGLSEVNIKGGKFEKTIYGAGAGGVNGIGTAEHHTDDDGIPYWNTDLDPGKTHVWYAPYDYIKGNGHNYEFVKIKMTDIGSADPNLEDGYVNMEKTRNIINITGGIFGSESSPASIYGGGFGEVNAALVNPSNKTNDANNIKNIYNTPNHQGGNMYGAADGLVTQINISGDAKIYGNIYGGGMGSMRYYRYFLRAAEEIVNYPDENQIYSRIYNPGGDTYNKPGGIDWLNVNKMRRNADNYLNLGQVFGNTKISISGNVEVFGNVYGAGEGVPDITVEEFFSAADPDLGLSDQLSSMNTILNYEGTATNGKRTAHITAEDTWVAFPNLGKLYGNSQVIIDGNTYIHGNVYGGGKAGAMDGNSTVVVKSGIIEGDVFGAGEGEAGRPDKAKVTGNTNVIVDSEWEE